MRLIFRCLPLLFCLSFAYAQSGFDVNIGFGASQDKSGPGLDPASFNSCSSATTGCINTSSLSSFMLGFGADLMLWKRLGFGFDASLEPAKQTYAALPADVVNGIPATNLQSRVTFYDINGIIEPISNKRAAVKLIGGIGGANLRFYQNFSGSNALIGNYNQSQYAGSSNHFQVHGGVGVQFYVKEHVFIRPQFDVHYVHNFFQFGRNLVTSEMVWLGYSWGDR